MATLPTNTFLKPKLIADTAIEVLRREVVLAPLIWTNGIGDFAGHQDDTINIRLRQPTTAREHTLRDDEDTTRKVVLDTLAEVTIPVALTKRIESAVPITDEELTLDITDFFAHVAARQIESVVQKYEDDIANLIETTSYTYSQTIDPSDPVKAFASANGDLNKANVSRQGRAVVVGADVETALITSKALGDASQAGDANALRNGQIGRLYGQVPVVGSNAIDPGAAYMFHNTAFVAAHRAPLVPAGAVSGQSVGSNGLAIRWIRDYDADYATDRSIFTVYSGYKAITESTSQGVAGPFKRGVKLTLGSS